MLRVARLLLVSGLLLACERQSELRIGIVVSYDASLAAMIAAEEANRMAPAGAPRIDVIIPPYTPPNTAAPAITIASELVDNASVVAVVGHSNSSASLAASPIYNRSGLLQIAPTSTAPALRAAGEYTFTLLPNDENQARFLVKTVLASAPRRLGIVYVNDDYGRGLLAFVRRSLPSGITTLELPYRELPDVIHAGGEIDRAAAVNADPFRSAIDRLRTFGPDHILWLGRPAPLGDYLDAVPASLRGLPITGSDALDSPLLYDNAYGRFNGIRFVRFLDPASADPQVTALRDAFFHRSGNRISSEAILTYDAVRLIASAVHQGAHDRKSIRNHVARIGSAGPAFNGASGRLAFDSAGEVAREYMLAEVAPDGVHAVSR